MSEPLPDYVDWQDLPSRATPISAANLQRDQDATRARFEQTVRVADISTPSTETSATLRASFESKVPTTRAFGPMRTLATSQHNGFAHAVTATDGSVVVVWRNGANHAPSKGVIQSFRFKDDQTLAVTASSAVSHATYDLRDPCVTRLTDGRIIMTYFVYDPAGAGAPVLDGCRAVVSTDNGATWGTPVVIDSSFTGWAAIAGPIVEAPDGALLAPTYGHTTGGTHQAAHVSRSTDGGTTWSPFSVIASAQGTKHYQEPNLIVTDAGDLLALVRSEPAPYEIVACRSSDSGATWSAPVLAFPGSASPRLTKQGGFLYAVYRSETTGRTLQRISADDGRTWSDAVELPYPTAKPSCAYGVAMPWRSDSIRYFYSVQSADTLTADVVQVDAIVVSDRTDTAPAGCRLRVSGFPSIADNTSTTVAFATEEADTHDFHTGDLTRVTIPAGMAGWYRITGNVMFYASATGRRQVNLARNGVLTSLLAIQDSPANATGETSLSVAADFVWLAAGDYVQMRVYQNSGGALQVRPEGTTLALSRVAAAV